MNVYLLIEDGESFCIRDETMQGAISESLKNYLDERLKEEGVKYDLAIEREFYHEQILQSCSLIGELKN